MEPPVLRLLWAIESEDGKPFMLIVPFPKQTAGIQARNQKENVIEIWEHARRWNSYIKK